VTQMWLISPYSDCPKTKITTADRVVLISGFVVAVFTSGAFIPSVSDKPTHSYPPTEAIIE
jgi:hypothetical protein